MSFDLKRLHLKGTEAIIFGWKNSKPIRQPRKDCSPKAKTMD